MKSVSLREFQLNASKYLDDLPVQLTRYNLPVAVVVGYKEGIMPEGFTPYKTEFKVEENNGKANLSGEFSSEDRASVSQLDKQKVGGLNPPTPTMSKLQNPNKCNYVVYRFGKPYRCENKPLANGRCEDHQ